MAKNTEEDGFDFSLAEPTEKQKAEEAAEKAAEEAVDMRMNPNEDSYSNFMYGLSAMREQPHQGQVTASVPQKVQVALDKSFVNPTRLTENARLAEQKRTGKFIAPNPNPTTFNELMKNWRAKDEYDEARYNQKEKWRKISQAIIGAGEIAARALTGASGEAATPDVMARSEALALDELRNLRARNRDQFNMALSHLTQEQQNRLQQQRLARQDAQWQAEMAYKAREANRREQKDKDDKAYRDALIKQGDTLNEIRAGEAQSRKAVNTSTIAKNNAQTAKTKTENSEYVSFGNKEYSVPKGTDYGSIFRQVRKRLIDLDVKSLDPTNKNDKAKIDVRQKILKARTDQYSAHTPNDFKFLIDDVARVMPDLVDDVIRSMQGTKQSNGNGKKKTSTSSSNLNFNLK